MPVPVLQMTDISEASASALSPDFQLLRWPGEARAQAALLAEHGAGIRAVIGLGNMPLTADLIAALPALEAVCCSSAGTDGLDHAALGARGIPVTNTSAVLAGEVADTAIWLLVSAARGLVQADGFLRAGGWSGGGTWPLGRSVAGMKVGILGLGHIGKEIARRLEVMGAEIAWHGRSPQDVPWPRHATLLDLATWADCLIVACPATPQTIGSVDAGVLAALGTEGILVNIARGVIVDEIALTEAIAGDRLFAAGLDVFAQEPQVPEALIRSPRTALLPHIGSGTRETRAAMQRSMVTALKRHFARG